MEKVLNNNYFNKSYINQIHKIFQRKINQIKKHIVKDVTLFNGLERKIKLFKNINNIHNDKNKFVNKKFEDKLNKYLIIRIGYKRYWKEFLELNKLQE